jgi:hypothetical protein
MKHGIRCIYTDLQQVLDTSTKFGQGKNTKTKQMSCRMQCLDYGWGIASEIRLELALEELAYHEYALWSCTKPKSCRPNQAYFKIHCLEWLYRLFKIECLSSLDIVSDITELDMRNARLLYLCYVFPFLRYNNGKRAQ